MSKSRKLNNMVFLLCILLLFIFIGCSPEDKPKLRSAKVTKVVDGDTVEVSINGKTEKIRLLLVDTPETVHPSKPVQPFGPEASAFAKEMLTGKEVGVEIDVSERDKYGRLLAYIWVGDKMFNELLLEQGLARVAYVYPPNVKYVDLFREVQKKAQLAGTGIWSIENYAQEDGFKDTEISQTSSQNRTNTQNSADQRDEIKAEQSILKGMFIASKSSKVYHEVDCPGGARNIKASNAIYFNSEEEAKASGRRMCHSTYCPL